MKRQITIQDAILYTCSTILLLFIFQNNEHLSSSSVYAISIKPADFDRLIMPCYLGGSYTPSASSYSGMPISSTPIVAAQNPLSPSSSAINSPGFGSNGYSSQASRVNGNGQSSINLGTNGASSNGPYQPTYYGMDSSRTSLSSSYNPSINRDSISNLGQQVPRANTIDNFIALVSKVEAANPRLANNPDQLIRTLLGRFRMDNYYYDVRSKVPISEQDHRTLDLIPAILNPFSQQQTQMPYALSSDSFPEHLLDQNEKCSMYFMLSHFIDKSSPSSPPLASVPVVQLTGPNGGQKPPVLQAAGTGYPAQSANNAFNGGNSNNGGTYRYPGPSPSFGSPATSNMNSFGSGISNNPEYTGNNPYGTNVLQPNNQFNQNYNNPRNTGQYSGTLASNSRYSTPFIDGGQGRSKNEKQALEFGVITIANQENAALVLNRVLMGILAAPMTPQPIRQLSSIIYPTQNILSTALKIDEDIDPLFAVTLADLWAVGAIPKAGKGVDPSLLGDNGRWNDTMCPTSFLLDRSSSIKFTTSELLGGLDGFNLGMFRRRLLSMRRNIRLSEMLRMYYSKTGFRPQFAEVGVCNRGSGISTQLDDLRRQAENYLRLYQLNTPISDLEITGLITRLEYFKDLLRQSANQYTPQEICQESALTDTYPLNPQDQCEISKADVSIVLDSSQQANEPFMNLVVAKFAQKLGLSRQGNSLSVLTNQQDTTGYAGSYSFNAIVRNSTNTGEIGCALTHDTSRSYQGGQVTDPTRLVEMFERALVNLDSEYLIRQQNLGGLTSSYRQSSYISSLFGQSGDNLYMSHGGGPSNTGGSKVIIWFNYGSQQKPSPIAASPTNWNSQNYNDQYKFNEAKKYLRENFRGASILAISNNREDVKAFVYDEERDILTDIPQGGTSVSSYDYSMTDPSNLAALNGPADQLVGKLLQRMCDIPAIFQYPMCFKTLSDNTPSVGYISPGRKQYWMMSPKTFFASHSVRMVFKVEGGRLRVCFGRMVKPDESAYKYQQQYPSSSITFNSGSNYNKDGQVLPSVASSSSNDYYTGLNYGICKDVSPGQEIDFTVDDPCYKKPIAECEPFYFVISEISNIGEGDPNYMCKEEGCKRFDQVKFVMTHSGVTCSSAYRMATASWLVMVISIITTLCMSQDAKQLRCNLSKITSRTNFVVAFVSTTLYMMLQQVNAQQAGVHDFGQNRYGEKRGNFTPSEILAIILLIMTILAGLALTIGLCYYVTKRNSKGMTRVEQEGY